MNITIICIGNELLSGKTINTNATWLGKTINSIGYDVHKQIVIPDDTSIIKNTLSGLMMNKEIDGCFIITGGLGPTHDDVTRKSIFEFFGSEEKFDIKYWEDLNSRFKQNNIEIPLSNKSQALIPDNGDVIDNPIGSARGYKFNKGRLTTFSLPGVPSEMKAMTEASIIPWLKQKSEKKIHEMTIRTTGIPESVLMEEISSVLRDNQECKIGFYPSLFGVDIQLSSELKKRTTELEKNISKILGHNIFGYNKDSMEQIVVKIAMKKKLSFSFAESCTGGLLGHRITEVPGSSDIFKGGAVVYSDDAKISVLGVDERCIKKYGAVSKETAKIMAEKVRSIFKSDYGVSVTGIAGPGGGTKKKPVGLVFVALANNKGTKVKKLNFFHDRKKNKLRTGQVVLNLMRLEMMNV